MCKSIKTFSKFGIFGQSEFQCKEKTNKIVVESFSRGNEFSMKLFLDEIKSVILEKYESEYWDESTIISVAGFFELSNFWCKAQREGFFNRILLLSPKLSIETLKEEMKHVVAEKHEFHNREESIPIAILGVYGLLGIWWTDYKNRCWHWKLLYMMKAFDWELDRGQAGSYGESWVWIPR